MKDPDKYLVNAPTGLIELGNVSDWITNELFLGYLKHFVFPTKPSKDQKILLLLGNHLSHVSLEAIEFCRQTHVVMLCFPAHTSDHLQPLDVIVYGLLKGSVGVACHDFDKQFW